MAVEDDPAYPEWRQAIEDLIEATSELNDLEKRTVSDSERHIASARVWAAQRAYNAAADKIGLVDDGLI